MKHNKQLKKERINIIYPILAVVILIMFMYFYRNDFQ